MKIRNYWRFMPKISRIMLVKCLKFGKFILIYLFLKTWKK
jgi:hypothetical protein